jgi:protein-disulfide isomerase
MTKEIRNLVFILAGVLVIGYVGYKFVLPGNETAQVATSETAMPTAPLIGNLAASHSFSYGPIGAKVTVVEYFDPECEACAAVAPYVKQQMSETEGKVRWVFRYMPYHFNSKTAIRALEAARKQNLFLEAKELLFENQKVWGEKKVSTEKEILQVLSRLKGLNINQLKEDMNDPALAETIDQDESEGQQAGVRGTPSFFINGVQLEQLDLDLLTQKINEQL